LEILEFNHETSRFQPRLYTFDGQGKQPPAFDPNPSRCQDCHQRDIRPNWDPYFFWTGFYGSEDDDAFSTVTHSPEQAHFAEFLKKQQQEKADGHGRYRFLPPHPAKRPNL